MYTVFYFVHLRYEITRDVVCVHASSVVRLASRRTVGIWMYLRNRLTSCNLERIARPFLLGSCKYILVFCLCLELGDGIWN